MRRIKEINSMRGPLEKSSGLEDLVNRAIKELEAKNAIVFDVQFMEVQTTDSNSVVIHRAFIKFDL